MRVPLALRLDGDFWVSLERKASAAGIDPTDPQALGGFVETMVAAVLPIALADSLSDARTAPDRRSERENTGPNVIMSEPPDNKSLSHGTA